jgi:protein-L-isoaspartate(D-aspartate) O-methyltransferase
VLAELAAEVWTIERDLSLAAMARRHLAEAGYRRVRVVTGDGSLGYPDHAPYEAISVAAGAPVVPVRLLEQLDEDGGRMVIPLGPLDNQELRLIRRAGGGVQERFVDYCRFVPLCGALAWRRNA